MATTHSSKPGAATHQPGTHASAADAAGEAKHSAGSHPGAGKAKDAGNFANDRQKASEAGHKGGKGSHGA